VDDDAECSLTMGQKVLLLRKKTLPQSAAAPSRDERRTGDLHCSIVAIPGAILEEDEDGLVAI